MNDSPISADAVLVKPVNDDPPDPRILPGMLKLALDRLESLAAAAAKAVDTAEIAKEAADKVNDRAASCELGEIIDALADIEGSFVDVQNELKSLYQEHAPDDGPIADADDIEGNGEDSEDDVARYLAVSNHEIEAFITAVGGDRVFSALDRLTAPVNANTAN